MSVPSGAGDFAAVMHRLRRRHFGMLATADGEGHPNAAGVVYAVARDRAELWVMTRTHLAKARNVAANRNVAFVVPLLRGALGFLPPPCVQFQGTAEVVARTDSAGLAAFRAFALGRTILRSYESWERRGETRVCFLRIQPGPVMFTYMVGVPIWRLVRRMERGLVRIDVPLQP